MGPNRLELQCQHKRVFEGGNRVRKKPEEIQKERKEEEEKGGDVRLRITFMGLYTSGSYFVYFSNNFILLKMDYVLK